MSQQTMTSAEFRATLNKPTATPAVVGPVTPAPRQKPTPAPPRPEPARAAPIVPLAAQRLATGPQCPVRYCVATSPLRREQFPDTFRLVVEGPAEWLAAVEAALQQIQPPS